MEAISNALHLGGYGIYFWPAFATAALGLCWMAVSTLGRLRRAELDLERLQRAQAEAATTGDQETGP
jgi:heme exporter protein CcmD